ncbi:cell division protein FtsZ [Piscinibacter sakaiensis]|uniref:cell division protein FtsZ n=1 Tax=Piscinibacter sakaiensis TaxID=1547922 RepID=UPI003AAA4C3E
MDDLTLALTVVGGIAVLGVIAYNSWQIRKAGPKRAASPVQRGDQREPDFGSAAPASIADRIADPASLDDAAVVGDAVADPATAPTDELGNLVLPVARPPRRAPARLDALIDVLVSLQLDSPVSAESVLSNMPPSRRAGTKPFSIEGLSVDSGDWELPVPGARYSELQAGVQMANRSGALNEIEYSEFIQKVQTFADALGAMVDFPDMLDVVARARELDAFAGQHDAQLAVLLRARGAAWSLGYIQQQAALQGLVPGPLPGRLVLPAADLAAPPVLQLSFDSQVALLEDPNQASLREVTLSFDVPQTDPASEPFAAWYSRATALATAMDAVVVDDRGQPLGPPAFASIDTELKRLYGALAERDLAAGSPAARRLFS